MGKRKELNIAERERIQVYHEEGYSQVEISTKKMKISRCCVQNTLQLQKETGKNTTRKRTRRPKKTKKLQDREIKKICLLNRRYTAEKIRSVYNQFNDLKISTFTVKNRLKKFGLHGRVAARKSLLRPINKTKRLIWAKNHQHWSIKEWKNVLVGGIMETYTKLKEL
ncbi:uncharacterized protein LOC136089991 [Hydra vulgaris]|uniref:Uncharacterized protein LOC136089991 n=1 Tax=Hydra vulgaris TaxID=6087 RepID=A0ABM4DCN2_HYDVU